MLRAALVAALLLAWPAQAEPALWLAQSKTARVYLFGTMHILPRPAIWLGPKIAAGLDASDTLWEEADVGLNDPTMASRIMAEAAAPGTDLWDTLPRAYAAKLRVELAGCGLNDAVVAHVRPWMAAMVVSICQMLTASGGKMGPMRDNPEASLLNHAHATGKKIAYFETAEQQIAIMTHASDAAQLGQLRQAIDEAADGKESFSTTETAWLNGDVAAIAATVAPKQGDDGALYTELFTDRNKRFAARIEDMLAASGTQFVAIGAGHLAGPDSVIAILQKHGVNVARQ